MILDEKCPVCGKFAIRYFNGKLYCKEHVFEKRQKSNKKHNQIQSIKQCGNVGKIAIAVIAGMIVIYQFISGWNMPSWLLP